MRPSCPSVAPPLPSCRPPSSCKVLYVCLRLVAFTSLVVGNGRACLAQRAQGRAASGKVCGRHNCRHRSASLTWRRFQGGGVATTKCVPQRASSGTTWRHNPFYDGRETAQARRAWHPRAAQQVQHVACGGGGTVSSGVGGGPPRRQAAHAAASTRCSCYVEQPLQTHLRQVYEDSRSVKGWELKEWLVMRIGSARCSTEWGFQQDRCITATIACRMPPATTALPRAPTPLALGPALHAPMTLTQSCAAASPLPRPCRLLTDADLSREAVRVPGRHRRPALRVPVRS